MTTALIERVVEGLDGVVKESISANWRDGDWTRQIKAMCKAIAEERGYEIYASGLPNSAGGEWLYDVTMMRYSETNGIEELALVLESEWIQTGWEIDNDFTKLVVSRADARVMIFQSQTLAAAGNVFERLKHLARAFPGSLLGDQYLLSCWLAAERRFEHVCFTNSVT